MAETPDKPEHEAHKAAEAPKTVTLAVAWPVTSHAHGDIQITQEGTEVPASKAKAIIAEAESAGARVYEVKAV